MLPCQELSPPGSKLQVVHVCLWQAINTLRMRPGARQGGLVGSA